ncbi:MAG: WYL domain-containing protein [Chlorogloea purpurea SAG 13.99]|nr:WYL domain-containing protein [Chlorogloea purpurea SAG 13.99]
MLLIATIVKYPGVGYETLDAGENFTAKHHEALEQVRHRVRELAAYLALDWPDKYPSIPTLRKDIETLRDYQILDRRMYRWGYYLGTGVMTPQELKIAFDALESQAIYQGDPRIRRVHSGLRRRLKGFEENFPTDFLYPVRQHMDRSIEYTDPEEMMAKGIYRETLYEHIHLIENAIVTGQALEVIRPVDPYQQKFTGILRIYPLQLIYRDIAWYLLYESCDDGCLAVGRLNRFSGYCKPVAEKHRSLEAQRQSLKNAHKLLKNGWGLNLGDVESQKLELEGKLPLVSIKVRFFHPVSYFIQEGEARHQRQKLRNAKIEPQTKKLSSIDYHIDLPPRSLNEFLWWVQRYLEHAKILAPDELVHRHYQSALALIEQYKNTKDNNGM